MDMSLSKLQEIVKDREVWPAVIHEVSNSGTGLSDWTPPPNRSNIVTNLIKTLKMVHIKIFLRSHNRKWREGRIWVSKFSCNPYSFCQPLIRLLETWQYSQIILRIQKTHYCQAGMFFFLFVCLQISDHLWNFFIHTCRYQYLEQ